MRSRGIARERRNHEKLERRLAELRGDCGDDLILTALDAPSSVQSPYHPKTRVLDRAIALAIGSSLRWGWWEGRRLPLPSTAIRHGFFPKMNLRAPPCTCNQPRSMVWSPTQNEPVQLDCDPSCARAYVDDTSERYLVLAPEAARLLAPLERNDSHENGLLHKFRCMASDDEKRFYPTWTPGMEQMRIWRQTIFERVKVKDLVRDALEVHVGTRNVHTQKDLHAWMRGAPDALFAFLVELDQWSFGNMKVKA